MVMVRAVRDYHHGGRHLAVRIKDPSDEEALQIAAAAMAREVDDDNVVFVPAPSSTGKNPATTVLATYLGLLLDAPVVVAVERHTPVESSHLRRRAGLPGLTVDEHLASMRRTGARLPRGRDVWLVDNVVTSGTTLAAMEVLLDPPKETSAVVYADAGPRARRNGPLRVCFAGSRGYRHLERVDDVLLSLDPANYVIVVGGARGVDERAERGARDLGFEVEVVRADWDGLGRAAGPERNRRMLARCDALYAFWDGRSRGTAHAIREAKRLDLDLEVILDTPGT